MWVIVGCFVINTRQNNFIRKSQVQLCGMFFWFAMKLSVGQILALFTELYHAVQLFESVYFVNVYKNRTQFRNKPNDYNIAILIEPNCSLFLFIIVTEMSGNNYDTVYLPYSWIVLRESVKNRGSTKKINKEFLNLNFFVQFEFYMINTEPW